MYISQSFLQTEKAAGKSDRYSVLTPDRMREVLQDNGLELVHLKTAKAKKAELTNFQTTVARYRDTSKALDTGLNMDIIIKAPHLYGSVEIALGLFRGICSNQLTVGTQFENFKVRHIGDAANELNENLKRLVAQREQLGQAVERMRSVILSPDEVIKLASESAILRLQSVENAKYLGQTYRPFRSYDESLDLFTVYNVIQENIVRRGVKYYVEKADEAGQKTVKFGTTRKMNDASVSAIDFNKQLFDLAYTRVS